MRVEDLLNFYRADRRAHLLNACWENDGSKAELKGIVGSAPALLAASLLSPGGEIAADDSALRDAPSHLFVLDDKESAAYFLNDLQQLIGDTHNVLFFPRSARVPTKKRSRKNANIAMRRGPQRDQSPRQGARHCHLWGSHCRASHQQARTLRTDLRPYFGREVHHGLPDEVFIEYGFSKVDFVYEPGQYAVRGGIVDVFSYSFDHPYRIEFFGDEVDSIRKLIPFPSSASTR